MDDRATAVVGSGTGCGWSLANCLSPAMLKNPREASHRVDRSSRGGAGTKVFGGLSFAHGNAFRR